MNVSLIRNRLGALSFLLFSFLPMTGNSSADHTADQILGRWLFPSQGSSVELYRSGDRYFGRVVDVSPVGERQMGLVKDQLIMKNLTFDGRSWTGGELINPKTGNRFGVELSMRDSRTLTASIYKGFRWLSKEYVLTRQTNL
ncbi:DUF2147 domain-containing protein [Spirosoma rigui]|uniref:DUF2147 domain-containing protein n=1 Tax=Spirosoma rigui TaxID=564064 RepID=UPI0009B06426|nr:DUF2147 domain-containing protein [Spirosoma rigui]